MDCSRSARLIFAVLFAAVLVLLGVGSRLVKAQTAEGPALPPSQSASGVPTASEKAAAQAAARQLLLAYSQLRDDEPGLARRTLVELIPKFSLNSAERFTAQTLLGQISGDVAQRRNAYFLNRKVIDAVVLVPDEAAFIRATGAWTDDVFFPILIEDAWLAPLFIRAFEPAAVYRFDPGAGDGGDAGGGGDRDDADVRVRTLLAEAVRDQNGRFELNREPAAERVQEAPPAPGIVVLDPNSPQRAGGLALALGRNQPILAFTSNLDHRRRANTELLDRLNTAILQALSALHIQTLDSFSAVTLAVDLPHTYLAANPDGNQRAFAVDDYLGRTQPAIRFAAVGRLTGNTATALYQANCSLFLATRSAYLYSSYKTDGARGSHRLDAAAERLERLGVVTQLHQNDSANVTSIRNDTQPVFEQDLLWINSAFGDSTFFSRPKAISALDLPIGRAHAAYMVASFSAVDPHNPNTIAYQTLANGAFWYFGSVHEPFLQAFVNSTELVNRATPPTPLLFAARQLIGEPYYQPWKLMLIGDPLYALRPRPADRLDRFPPLENLERLERSAIQELIRSDPAEALRLAALVPDADASLRYAAATAALPLVENSSPDLVAQIAYSLYVAGDMRAIATLPILHARRHPVSHMLAGRGMLARASELIASGKAEEATPLILPILTLHPKPQLTADGLLADYLAAMESADRAVEARRLLRDIGRLDLPQATKGLIQETLGR